MLSQQQFEKKHAARFAKLSSNEKSKRYEDYKRASKGGSKPKRQPRNRNRGPRGIVSTINPPGQIRQLEKSQIRTDEYGMGRKNYPKKQPNRRATIESSSGGSVKLSMCGKLYISGLLLPFQFFDGTNARYNRGLGMSGDIPTELPCVPTFPSIKSRRHKVFIRGSSPAGSYQNFHVVFAPRRVLNNYYIGTDDFAPLFVSNGSSDPGTSFAELDVRAALVTSAYTGYNFNTDYAADGSVGPNTTVRLVCAGVRIRYAGAEMSMSGICHAVEEPNHYTLNGASISQFSNYESYFRCPVSKKWCTLTYNPVAPEEYEYQPDAYYDPSTTGNVLTYRINHHYMGFLVQGLATGSLLEFEACAVLEIVGENIRDLKMADSDMQALQIASNHVNPSNQQVQNESPPSLIKTMMNSAKDFTAIIPEVLTVAKTIM